MTEQTEMTIEELEALFSEMDDTSLTLFAKVVFSALTERGISITIGPQGIVFFDDCGWTIAQEESEQ